MFKRYLQRNEKKRCEEVNYRIKRISHTKTHAQALSVQTRITNNIRVKHLQKYALRLIQQSPVADLVDVVDVVLADVLAIVLENGGALALRAAEKLVRLSGDNALLLKYFQCYACNDADVAAKFLKMALRVKKAWVCQNRAEICALINDDALKRCVARCVDVDDFAF